MGPSQAVGHRPPQDIAEADDPAPSASGWPSEYAASTLRPSVAAREGYIDEVVEPDETRGAWPGAGGAGTAVRFGNGAGSVPL